MRNNAGFTLTSLMVSLGITVILMLIIGGLFALVNWRHSETRDRLEAELVLARAERIFRNYFSQAIDVSFDNVAMPAGSFPLVGVPGWIRGGVGIPTGVDYDQIADMGGADWHTVALFWREDSTRLGTQAYGGHPRKTGIWYRRPTRTTSGVIFVDGGPDNTTSPGGPLSPSFNDSFLDRISGFRLQKNRSHIDFNKTTSIDVTLRVRYHTHHRNGFNWCPALDIQNGVAACVAPRPAAIKDLERTFRIVLQNGLIRAAAPGIASELAPTDKEERTLGNLYFFKLFNPARL